MSIVVNLDILLVKRKMKLTELTNRVGITIANLSILNRTKLKQSSSQRLKLFAVS